MIPYTAQFTVRSHCVFSIPLTVFLSFPIWSFQIHFFRYTILFLFLILFMLSASFRCCQQLSPTSHPSCSRPALPPFLTQRRGSVNCQKHSSGSLPSRPTASPWHWGNAGKGKLSHAPSSLGKLPSFCRAGWEITFFSSLKQFHGGVVANQFYTQ